MPERTFTALIVDDEALARALVREHLAEHPEVRVLAECRDGFEAVRCAAELKPDLLFLDIQMPQLDGFELLELLDPRPVVVFITAHDQHAIRAFEVHAVDYLLKPFSEERFAQALSRAKARCGKGPGPDPAALGASARAGAKLERLVVKDGVRVTLVPLGQIDYIQAQDDYVLLKTAGRGHLKQQTLASLEPRLDPGRFLRIHRSYILQLDRLARLERTPTESWVAVLRDGTRLPVSRSGRERLKQLLQEN
jgi:two-component system LytT family response regulator